MKRRKKKKKNFKWNTFVIMFQNAIRWLYCGVSFCTVHCVNSRLTATICFTRWLNCGVSFGTLDELVNHLTLAHVTSQQGSYFCMWHGCARDKGFNARWERINMRKCFQNYSPFLRLFTIDIYCTPIFDFWPRKIINVHRIRIHNVW